MASATEIYETTIKPLPTSDRLALAKLILDDIPQRAVVDYSEEWTEEDLRGFSRHSLDHINRRLEEEESGAKPR